MGWLRVVARREAIRLAQYDRRLARLASEHGDPRAGRTHLSRLLTTDALGMVAALPARKRAVLTLHVAGHSYREMAVRLCMSERRVERQLLRARRAVRRANAEPSDRALTA
jgi:DNA-directed RNA polymerase specialized sigma24 family protein